MTHYIGVDLGGTNLRAAIVDVETGEICRQSRCPTLAAEGQDAVIARIVQLVRGLASADQTPRYDILGVGIGVPGTVDIRAGTTLILPNLPGMWRGVSLQKILEAQMPWPV